MSGYAETYRAAKALRPSVLCIFKTSIRDCILAHVLQKMLGRVLSAPPNQLWYEGKRSGPTSAHLHHLGQRLHFGAHATEGADHVGHVHLCAAGPSRDAPPPRGRLQMPDWSWKAAALLITCTPPAGIITYQRPCPLSEKHYKSWRACPVRAGHTQHCSIQGE